MRKNFTNNLRSGYSDILWMYGIALLILATSSQMAFAIADSNVRNTDYKADQSLKSNARINPSTLALEFSIPIGGYQGRGGGLPIVFNYSSKVWQIFAPAMAVWQTEGNTLMTDVKPLYGRRTAAGWTSNLGVPRIDYELGIYEGAHEGGYFGQPFSPYIPYEPNPPCTLDCPTPFPNYTLFYVKRVQVTMPDGSTHEFRKDDQIHEYGTSHAAGGPGLPDLIGTFLSVDGSRMRLDLASSQSTLYLPDGSRYLFGQNPGTLEGHLANALIDRNGNKMTFNSSNRQWTDTMGRVIADPMPLNWQPFEQNQVVEDKVAQFPGKDGSGTLNVTFSWRYLKDPNGGESGLEDISQSLHYTSNKYCHGNWAVNVPGPYLFNNPEVSVTRVCAPGYAQAAPPFNPIVLTKITLPNGQNYQFKYNVFGEVVKITYPTGAYERFQHKKIPAVQGSDVSYNQANRGVTERWVSPKGDGSDEIHWSYEAISQYQQPFTVRTTNPDGTKTEQYIYSEPTSEPQPFGFGEAKTGRSYEDRMLSASGQLLRRKLTKYTWTAAENGASIDATRDLRPEKEVSIIFEPGESYALASMTETVYDSNADAAYFASMNAKQQKVYHYIVLDLTTAQNAYVDAIASLFTSGNLATITEIDYLYSENYKARNITGLVAETRIKDAIGNVRAKSQVGYDETGSYPILTYGSSPSQWENPNTDYRGNVTTSKSWTDIASNQYVQTHAQYDSFGNLRKSWDANGNLTQTEYSSDYAYAYPTLVKSPVPDTNGTHGSNAEFVTTTTYDFNTGLSLTVTDPNQQVTAMEYNDALYRLTKVTVPNYAQTITEYGAGTSPSTRWIKVKTQIDAQYWKESYAWYDGIARSIKTQQVDSNGDVFVETEYDNIGRVKKVSNPYRTGETVYKTENFYDDLSRITKVKTPDNAEALTAYSLAGSGDQIGTVVTTTDQAGKLRRSIANALGQVTRVDEPNNSNQLGAISSPNQPTLYKYNLIGKMSEVTQGAQQRHFMFDALGRLLRLKQPEQQVNSALNMSGSETTNTQWSVGFTYDGNGSVLTTTDAKNVTTTSTFDGVNRVKTKTYSNGLTPTVDYYYDDSNASNSKGQLTKVTSSISETRYTSFDSVGKLTASEQTTNGQTYSSSYQYGLGGNLIEQTYPTGRVVKNFLNSEANLSAISSKSANGPFKTYAANFSYTPSNVIKHLQLGNGLWESATLNARQQVTSLKMGTSSTDGSRWTVTTITASLT